MAKIDNSSHLSDLVDYFYAQGNFDHPDMEKVVRIGERLGISALDSAKAFFIAREKASLVEGALLESDGSNVAEDLTYYGPNSLHEMLFENSSRKQK